MKDDHNLVVTETAVGKVCFNEYGDYLDRPYLVRALRSFDVNLIDEDGRAVDDETFHVEKDSTWEIWHAGHTNDLHLDGDGAFLELSWSDLVWFALIEEGGYSGCTKSR